MDAPDDDEDDDTQQPRRRTGEHAPRVGGRSERVVRDVLGATARELARAGYAALRMEDVAAVAGVNKTTVYRRWPTKRDLVRATLNALHEADTTAPDLGSIKADLKSLLDDSIAKMEQPEKLCIARMMFAEMDHPEVHELVSALREAHLEPWRTVVARSIERGELPSHSDARLIVDVVLGSVMSAMIRFGRRKEPGYLAAVVDLVVAGARCGGAIREAEASAGSLAPAMR